jgi:hypothetical protein
MNQESKEFIRVYRASNSTEGHLIKGMLEQYGMLVRIFGDGLSSGVGELPADVMQVEIQVQPGYRELARQLIHEYENRATEEVKRMASWPCSDCGEENPPSFDICWKCQRPGGGSE